MKMIKLLVIAGLVLILVKGVSAYSTKEQVIRLLERQAERYDVDSALVKAITRVESNFNPRAKNPLDPSFGLMQIRPMLAQDYGYVEDWRNPTEAEIRRIFKPEINTEIGCRQLNYLSAFGYNAMVHGYNVGISGYFKGSRNWNYFNLVSKYHEQFKSSTV